MFRVNDKHKQQRMFTTVGPGNIAETFQEYEKLTLGAYDQRQFG